MTETKSEAFHRLAGKRVETIEDALRIFSNLCGPSYEWTQEEVETYFGRIHAARDAALQRFAETKRWGAAPALEPEAIPDMPPAPEPVAANTITPRQAEMLRIWDEVASEQGALVEVLAMQREVIATLQQRLDQKREAHA